MQLGVERIHIRTTQPIKRGDNRLSKSWTNLRIENLSCREQVIGALNLVGLNTMTEQELSGAFLDVVRRDMRKVLIFQRVDQTRCNSNDFTKSRPGPAFRNPKRNLVCDALVAQNASLSVHVFLIGGAIGTDIDNALPALREFSLTISNKLMLLFTNTLKQDACRLITRVLWNELSLNRHLQD